MYLASFTFTLYLIHFPIYTFVRASIDYDRSSPLAAVGLVALVVTAAALAGLVTDRRKGDLRRLFAVLFQRLADKLRAYS